MDAFIAILAVAGLGLLHNALWAFVPPYRNAVGRSVPEPILIIAWVLCVPTCFVCMRPKGPEIQCDDAPAGAKAPHVPMTHMPSAIVVKSPLKDQRGAGASALY